MKIGRHQPIDSNGRYVATFGRLEKMDLEQNTLLGITDTETGNYTCLDRLAGTFYEDQIFNTLNRTEYGKNLDEINPVEDRYQSERELELVAEGLETSRDQLVDEYGIEGAFEMLEMGHPKSTEADETALSDSAKARKKSRHFY
ncbi:MAG: hypothetical protein BRC29_02715 [Nanohaloarchaea archaeon SW_7_43_1]|nr:MAG: hypothetical protein BRC29_02715 [Nanohaloarchaea archaeon SW_7_43_1]